MTDKAKWHRFPYELPPNDGQYITCDSNKNMQVCFFMKEVPRSYTIYAGSKVEGEKLTNVFLWGRTAQVSRNPQVRKNIWFWTDLPDLPEEIISPIEEIEKLRKKIKELQDKIKQFDNMPASNINNH